ncbi:MAG TPA: hypothetical protein VMF91_07755 [Bryobacteraceae bacterium]|nr:hypothetical protein [Bryobacteraceae bacterium]
MSVQESKVSWLPGLLACLTVPLLFAGAAIPGSAAAPPLLSHDDAESVLSQALSLPPVYAADLLLRVASGVRFRLPADQARFVSSALDLAPDVPFETKSRGLLGLAESEAALEVIATVYGIDRQSLTLRGVSAYLSMGDAASARRVFQQLQLNPKPVACGSEVAPDFAFYYRTAGQLFASAFTPTPRAKGEDIDLLRNMVAGVVSVGQLPPVISLIAGANLKPAFLEELTSMLVLRMKNVYPDPAVLQTDVIVNDFFASFGRLAEALDKQGDTSGLWELFLGLRSLLLSQAATACNAGSLRHDAADLPKLLSTHYTELISKYPNVSVPDLPVTALKPLRIEKITVSPGRSYWESQSSKDLMMRGRAVRDDPDNIEKASALLQSVDNWQENDEDDALAYFHERAVLYEALIEYLKDPVLRTSAVLHYMSFLQSSNSLYASGSPAWIVHFRRAVYLALDAKPDAKRAQIISQLQQSQNPVISTYARFLDLLPSSAWMWFD